MSYLPQLTNSPSTLIGSNGQPTFGLFTGSVADLALDKLELRTEMDSLASRLRRRFGYKQFQFVCVQGVDFILAVAIADVRFVNSGFAYLYRPGFDTLELSLLHPLALRCQMSDSPSAGRATLGGANTGWQLTPSSNGWQVQLRSKRLQVDIELLTQQQPPLALCAPTGYSGFTYTEKNNALKVHGTIVIDGQSLDVSSACGGYDFSTGYMRRETSWRWASINTYLPGDESSAQASAFGLNLAAGVNETGLCENALWFKGERQHLSPAQFTFDRQRGGTWQIRTLCGEVDLSFTPAFCRQERLNLWLLASNFRQYVGHFSGNITLRSGHRLILDQVQGLTEDHYAKW